MASVKLLTKDLQRKLPPLHSTAGRDDPIVHAHYFARVGRGDWFVIEGGADGDDYIFCSLCCQADAELGYVRLSELEGRGVERDRYWRVRPLSQVPWPPWSPCKPLGRDLRSGG